MSPSFFPHKFQISLFIFPILFLLAALTLHTVSESAYWMLFGVLEGGLLEWAQFINYLIAAYLGLRTFNLLRRHSLNLQSVILLAFSLGCLFVALEEVSYGQHIFKWATPESLASVNYQKETNVHNLAVIQLNNIQVKAFIVVGWFGAIAWLFRRSVKVLTVRDLVCPNWYTASFFFPLAIFYTQLLYVWHFGNDHQETFETVLSFGFLSVAFLNYRKVLAWVEREGRAETTRVRAGHN